jgi:hypothetical protein
MSGIEQAPILILVFLLHVLINGLFAALVFGWIRCKWCCAFPSLPDCSCCSLCCHRYCCCSSWQRRWSTEMDLIQEDLSEQEAREKREREQRKHDKELEEKLRQDEMHRARRLKELEVEKMRAEAEQEFKQIERALVNDINEKKGWNSLLKRE